MQITWDDAETILTVCAIAADDNALEADAMTLCGRLLVAFPDLEDDYGHLSADRTTGETSIEIGRDGALTVLRMCGLCAEDYDRLQDEADLCVRILAAFPDMEKDHGHLRKMPPPYYSGPGRR